MQSAVDEKKKLELRVDNISGELNKAKTQVTELESSKQQLQVRVNQQHRCQAAASHPVCIPGVCFSRLIETVTPEVRS